MSQHSFLQGISDHGFNVGAPPLSKPITHERPLLGEELFLRTLSVERKRTERSGSPFGLILIDDLDGFKPEDRIFERVGKAISSWLPAIDVAGWFSKDSCLGIISAEIGQGDRRIDVILAGVKSALESNLTPAELARLAISLHQFPSKVDEIDHSIAMQFYPDVPVRERERQVALIIKRAMDVVGSLAALVIFSPVFLAIALMIKFTSKGPILFKQARIGRYGKKFTFLKFRSMYANNDPKIHQDYVSKLITKNSAFENADGTEEKVFKIKNDPRVTWIGRFLRKSSLDELPQFFNVLRGEMSLVGPRPPVLYEYDQYDVWHRRRSLEIKPGITGLWQVSGRSRTSFDEMVRLDLKYARDWSIAMDIKILFKTPYAVISGDGAY
jgi:exopolysaccharide biosynthesis polyprenyl glycosylphosphotransferase